MIRFFIIIYILFFSEIALFAQESEPHLKTKLCNPEETVCTDVTSMSGVKRARVDATLSGGSDGTIIGNTGDRLKVDSVVTVLPATASFANILKQNEISVITKTKTAIANTTYTVASGKSFALASFGGSYDTQSPMYLRFEKQTGGTGAFQTLFRVTLKQHGQDESNHEIDFSVPVFLGQAGDVFRITYESALSKGTLWSGFTGIEY